MMIAKNIKENNIENMLSPISRLAYILISEAKGEKGEARRHYLTYLAYDSASTDAAEVRQRVAELRR